MLLTRFDELDLKLVVWVPSLSVKSLEFRSSVDILGSVTVTGISTVAPAAAES